MWIVLDEKQQEESRKRMEEQMRDALAKAREKDAARQAHIERTTCPHCGRHEELPPWLM